MLTSEARGLPIYKKAASQAAIDRNSSKIQERGVIVTHNRFQGPTESRGFVIGFQMRDF